MPSATTKVTVSAGQKKEFTVILPYNHMTVVKAKGELKLWDAAGNEIDGIKAGCQKDFDKYQDKGKGWIQSTADETVILFWGHDEKLSMPAPGTDPDNPAFTDSMVRALFNSGGTGLKYFVHQAVSYSLAMTQTCLKGCVWLPAGVKDNELMWAPRISAGGVSGDDSGIGLSAVVPVEFNFLTLTLGFAPVAALVLRGENCQVGGSDPANEINFTRIYDVMNNAFVASITAAGIYRLNVTGLNRIAFQSNEPAPAALPIRWALNQGGALQ